MHGPSPNTEHLTVEIEARLRAVCRWVEARDYLGYEPFDGLTSYLRRMTCRNEFAERLLIQLVRQSPINLRPVLGVRPTASIPARGYFARGYLKMYQRRRDQADKDKAVACLDWIVQHRSPRSAFPGWGNRFDFTSRGGRLPKLEPTIVWTSLIGQAFLDAFEVLNDERCLHVAESICTWILALPREHTPRGDCLSYVSHAQESVHNSNMLGAAMLARAAIYTGNDEAREVARQAMEYSCARQNPDGSWYYGEQPNLRWIDSFHTGYNLDSLKCYIDSTRDRTYKPHLDLGFQFFKRAFFESDGRPRYYHSRVYPIDIQCAAQGIDTLVAFTRDDPGALDMARTVARWTLRHMQDTTGYFYYRRLPWITVRTPMLHWGQATMFHALASLLSQLTAAMPAEPLHRHA